MIKCKKCKLEFEDKLVDEHHLHPKFMNNPNGDGMKLPLCKKCHNILHLLIAKWIWDNKNSSSEYIINYVKQETLRWIN